MKLPSSVLRAALLAALPLSLSPFASAALFSDPDADWEEAEYALPPAPRDGSLREIFVSSSTRNRFFIDEDSIAVGSDGVVRYVLVVEASGGARNVSVEGIRCATWTWRMYATGRQSGEWSPTRAPEWQAIVNTSYNRVRAALATDHFCDGTVPPRDRDEVLRRVRSTTLEPRYHGQ